MKKIFGLLLITLFYACEPFKVVETTSTDSTGKIIKVKTKYYQQTDGVSITPSFNVVSSPILYGGMYPYFRSPVLIYQAPIRVPYRSNRRH
jgi:hypothetical protein